ncbi:hypothetical protein J2Z48_002149 [Croceifilum oryzae]|uniref:Uncharacterized protein n=1 Tax=Croceifilum oryzae TaxID=1553429 RepID=A0AAJ1TFG2_9BACL|nr:hypothetical protein [Croceifilum oryzae]MDQ0417965.1 hypothetical protein [Croceifilum oryzae]
MTFLFTKKGMGCTYHLLDLENLWNNNAIAFMDRLEESNASIGYSGTSFGTAFPAQDLPNSKEVFESHGIPFLFPIKKINTPNNVECNGQMIDCSNQKLAKIHFVGCTEQGDFTESIQIHASNQAVYSSDLSFSEWILREPKFGEREAIRTSGIASQFYGFSEGVRTTLWLQTISVSSEEPISHIVLPVNENMHIFCITLQTRDL